MSEPLLPPFLIFVGIAFGYWGWRKTYRAMTKPASEFRFHPQVKPKTKLETTLMRLTEAFDSISIFIVGVAVFIFGIVDLMGVF